MVNVVNVLYGIVGFGAGWLARRAQDSGQRARANDTRDAQRVTTELTREIERAAATLENMAELTDSAERLRAVADDFQELPAELLAARASAEQLRETAAALDKQIGRIGREQFKANALNETQQQQAASALEQLRDLSARRETDLALLREQLRADHAAQRLTVIQQLLPALDGLDEALASGQRLFARTQQTSDIPTKRLYTFSERMAMAMSFVAGKGELARVSANGADELPRAAAAWLAGIALVRERLLHVLASEGVQPIVARGEPFDPHAHIAVEAVVAPENVAPGVVVQEYRRGYRVGERVLRAAEVVVAKEVTGERDE